MDIYAVGQIARYVRETLESSDFLADLWVMGEISNVSRSTAGHLYFTLKDAAGQLRCVGFRNAITGGFPLGSNGLEDGAQVVVHGRMSFYEARGDLQFLVDVVMPQGAGALHMEFQRLKAKLTAEGLFDETRRRPLPQFPRRIAVITSPAGAVFRDIVNVISRRYPLVELLLFPVAVQGDRAAESIAGAFRLLNQREDVDLAILARGGGSIEELWPFNEERTARAVYGSRMPVISAVGHETDFTMVDYVADVRAPTPSAAAELAVPDRAELHARLSHIEGRLRGEAGRLIARYRESTGYLRGRLSLARADVNQDRQRVDDTTRSMLIHLRAVLARERAGVERCLASLSALDPQRTLARGYALVRHKSTGRLVVQRAQVAAGDPLEVRVSDGSFGATADGASPPRAKRVRRASQEQLALFPR